MTLEEVRALEALGSNLGGRGGHLTAEREYEWGGSVAKLEAGRGSEGRTGGTGEAAGAGHGRLTRGRRSSTPQETGCPRSGGNRDHPQCPRAARQSHPRNSAARPSLPPQVGAVDSGGAPQPQDPGTGSGSSAAQGRTPTPAAAMMD